MASLFEELRRIAYFAYVEVEGKLWISNVRYNGIYSIDIQSGELCFWGRIPGCSVNDILLHSGAIEYHKNVFFLPQLGNSIDEFCLGKGMVASYPINLWKLENGYVVAGFFLKEDKLYLIPKNLRNPIIFFSLETKEYGEVVFEGFQRFLKELGTKKDILTLNAIEVGDSILFAIYESNYLVELNLIDGTEIIHEIPSESGLDTIGYDGVDFWLGQCENVVRWNLSKGVIDIYKGVIGECEYEKNIVAQFIPYGDSIYVVPQYLGAIGKINKRTKGVTNLSNLPEDYRMVCDGTEKWRHLRNAYIRENELIINPVGMNMELHIDLSDDSVYGKEYLAQPITVGCTWQVYSEEEVSLGEFIDYKVLQRGYASKRQELKTSVGRTIYEAIGDETIG